METNKKKKLSQWWKNLSLSWKIFGAIITVVTFGFLIYDHIQPTRNPQDAILGSIGTIKERFQPNSIPSELDSIVFVKEYKRFQVNVLDVCDSWIQFENELSHTEPAEPDAFSVESCVGRNNLYKIGAEKMTKQMMEVVISISSLYVIAEDDYNKGSWINIDECHHLTKLSDKKKIIMTEYLEKAGKYAKRGKVKKGMMEFDKMKKDKDYLEFDNEFFKYCIQVKECCNHILKDNGIRY